MSRNDRKGNTKQGVNQDKELETKVAMVKGVTDWPEEDIKRVLEENNFDPQRAIEAILEGYAGHKSEDWTTVGKKLKESKEQKTKDKFNRPAKKSNSVVGDVPVTKKERNQIKEVPGTSPNTSSQEPRKPEGEATNKPVDTNTTQEQPFIERQNLPPRLRAQRKEGGRPPQTQQTQQANQAQTQVQTQTQQPSASPAAQQPQKPQPPIQKPAASTTTVQHTQQPAKPIQQQQPQQPPQQQQQPQTQPQPQTASSASTSAAASSASSSYNAQKASRAWKPKDQASPPAPSSPSTPVASQPAQQPTQAVQPAQTQQPAKQAPVQPPTQQST